MKETPDDLLMPFTSPEPMPTIQTRLQSELTNLPDGVKQLKNPQPYPVEFDRD
jgi:hypothetical protein